MLDLDQIIQKLITRNIEGQEPITLLAVCPNSEAVLEAAVRAASRENSIMLFAATLNQVDYEASYTGWTPEEFVNKMKEHAIRYGWMGPLYPCLDHGGPWLKDLHTLDKLNYSETMEKVKKSITACIRAGYRLLHIDPTIDRTYAKGETLPVELVVERTVELIEHAEKVRSTIGACKVAYEVGTEEVHGGLVDFDRFIRFVEILRTILMKRDLGQCWPCLFVAQIGTDLHTTKFDPKAARQLNSVLAPLGSLIKGHYTDWVENPEAYPANGIGAANVGPEFTALEFSALQELERYEVEMSNLPAFNHSNMIKTIEKVVIESGRWKKWLMPEEESKEFDELLDLRKDWLTKTGARYIWNNPEVVAARKLLYRNVKNEINDPNEVVVEKITIGIEKYIHAFNLKDSASILS